MSLLSVEYDVEVAKRVYAEELLEERNIEIVRNMLVDGFTMEQISRITGLCAKEIRKIKADI